MDFNFNYAIEQYKLMWQNGLNFEGRTSRRDFWHAFVINCGISIILSIIGGYGTSVGMGVLPFGHSGLSNLYGLAVTIPGLAIGARRLHDIGKSGWYQLIILIPIIGFIILILSLIKKGQEGANEYGASPESPKNAAAPTPDFGSEKPTETKGESDDTTPAA